MPGPRNQKKKKHAKNTATKNLKPAQVEAELPKPGSEPAHVDLNVQPYNPPSSEHASDQMPPPTTHPPPPQTASNALQLETHHFSYAVPTEQFTEEPAIYPPHAQYPPYHMHHVDEHPIPPSLLKTSFIHDPGNGPRVKDARAFLASSFASPPSLDDPMCAEFAEEAVLQMLCTALPEETALILWYNKSRRMSRICPACQRLYRLGDVLPDHLTSQEAQEMNEPQGSPYRAREQELSGLCSPVCFILASYNYPGAIRSTWGRMAEELDDATWDLLDGPGQRANDMGLGMLLKMTRCHDLGLGQLFFPDLDLESDATCNEPEGEGEQQKEKEKWEDGEKENVVEVMERLRLEETVDIQVVS